MFRSSRSSLRVGVSKLLLPLLGSGLAVCLLAVAARPAAGRQTAAPGQPAPAKPAATAKSQAPTKSAALSAPARPADLDATAWKLLSAAAVTKRYQTRSDALAAMVEMGSDSRSVGALEHALADDNEASIRVLAAATLGEVKAQAAVPALRAALDDRAPQVSFAAAQALWHMGDRSGRNIFYAVLEGDRKAQPGVVESGLGKVRQDMREPKTMVLISVNAASAALLGPGALGVSAIEAFALNKTSGPRALSARLLADDDTAPTITELRDALEDKDWSIRAAACRSLATLNHPEVIPDLHKVMDNDKRLAARLAAAAAIARLSHTAAH